MPAKYRLNIIKPLFPLKFHLYDYNLKVNMISKFTITFLMEYCSEDLIMNIII